MQNVIETDALCKTYGSHRVVDHLALTVPEGCVFVLGDNRSVSKDSRYAEVGMIDERHILGEAVFRLYPFNRFGKLQ